MEVYVDDILVGSLDKEEYVEHLGEAFRVLVHQNMMLNPTRCDFAI